MAGGAAADLDVMWSTKGSSKQHGPLTGPPWPVESMGLKDTEVPNVADGFHRECGDEESVLSVWA